MSLEDLPRIPNDSVIQTEWEHPSAWAEDLMYRTKELLDDVLKVQDELIEFKASLQQDRNAGRLDGATFIPYVTTDGWLSWTNNRSLENPPMRNLKGDKGDDGACFPEKGYFALDVDDEGNLYLYYDDEGTRPKFELEQDTGKLFFVVEE